MLGCVRLRFIKNRMNRIQVMVSSWDTMGYGGADGSYASSMGSGGADGSRGYSSDN